MVLSEMPSKFTPELIAAAIAGFEEQKKRLDAKIADLRQMLTPASNDKAPAGLGKKKRRRRRLSAEARARIAETQRKRWAALKKGAGTTAPTTPVRKKRRLSAAGRRAIIEATKRRWAAVRTAKKR